jgi:formate/nitrite transporter FocA (FNT family)
MKRTYWTISVLIGMVLSSILLAGAGIGADYLYSAPEKTSKLIVAVFFSLSIIVSIYKAICMVFKKQ